VVKTGHAQSARNEYALHPINQDGLSVAAGELPHARINVRSYGGELSIESSASRMVALGMWKKPL
jgi:hypothetical protein